jgi:hypothetical protein
MKPVTRSNPQASWPGLKAWWEAGPQPPRKREDMTDHERACFDAGMDGWGMTEADRSERAKGKG